MATQSISGSYGTSSGSLSGSSASTSFGYNTGWTSVPIGSRIWSFGVSFSADCGGGELSAYHRAYAWGGWPAEIINWTEDGWNIGSASAGASAGTPAADFIKFFEGNPGDIGGAEAATTETFYPVSYDLNCSSSGTLTFDPAPSKTLFFGAVG